MKPEYAEKIIVAIIANGDFQWYILDVDWCYLDDIKWGNSFKAVGFDVPEDDSYRFGIKIVNKESQYEFLKNIECYRVSADRLNTQMLSIVDSDEILAYQYAVLINFDEKKLISYFYEPLAFENFVPDGWEGLYEDFESLIPNEKKYWLKENGYSLL